MPGSAVPHMAYRSAGQRPGEDALQAADERGQLLVGGDRDDVAAVPVGAGVGLLERSG